MNSIISIPALRGLQRDIKYASGYAMSRHMTVEKKANARDKANTLEVPSENICEKLLPVNENDESVIA